MVMDWLYGLIGNFGLTIILFTVIIRVLMYPLSISQQKNSARMAAYQPFIKEIQAKWANDRARQNQEIQKFYEENKIKMSVGCLPLAINMIVLFGMIGAIQAPMTYILQVPQEQVNNAVAIVEHYDAQSPILEASLYTQQALLIGEIKDNPELFVTGITSTNEEGEAVEIAVQQEFITAVEDMHFEFLSFDLSQAPDTSNFYTLILPIISLLTMIGSQLIIMFNMPSQQGKGSLIVMTLVFSGMFAFYAFTVPSGFSLYYTTSNILQTIQQLVNRKVFSPEKFKQQIKEEIEARKAAKKALKKVAVRSEDGSVSEVELNQAELARLRLERARQMDAERYGISEQEEEEYQKLSQQMQDIDAERYNKKTQAKTDVAAEEAGAEADTESATIVEGAVVTELADTDTVAEGVELAEQAGAEAEATDAAETTAEPAAPAKPGRRKRARQNKENASAEGTPEQGEQASDTQEVDEDA